MNDTDRRDLLEAALHHLTAAAEALHDLDDPHLNRTVLPECEGREAGWAGTFAADLLREAIGGVEHVEHRGCGRPHRPFTPCPGNAVPA